MLAAEIVPNLEAALEQFRKVAAAFFGFRAWRPCLARRSLDPGAPRHCSRRQCLADRPEARPARHRELPAGGRRHRGHRARVARLRDKSLAERAEALIQVAAPGFRGELADGWPR
jgi:hypothetical protein